MHREITDNEENGLINDRYGIVSALSNLSQSMHDTHTESVYEAAAETCAALLHVSNVLVFVRDTNGGLSVVGGQGIKGNKPIVAVASEIASEVLDNSTSIVYPKSSSRFPDTSRKLADLHIAALAAIPMRVGEIAVGAIIAMSDKLRPFSGPDLEIMQVVASQAALSAWRTADVVGDPTSLRDPDTLIKLAQRKIHELSLMNQVSDAMNSTLDLEKLLDIALEQSMALVGADGGSLMLVNEESGKLEITTSRRIEKKYVQKTSQEVGISIAGWVAQHGESVLASDVRKDPRFQMPYFRDDITSAASVPLKNKGEVIGVLNVNTVTSGKTFDERDLQLLGMIANQMASAIEKARLHARVNRRTLQLDSLLQITKTVSSTLNLEEVLHRLSSEIMRLFQLDVCVLILFDDLSGRLRLGHGTGLKRRRRYEYYDLAAPIASRIKETGKKVVVRDIRSSPRLKSTVSDSEELLSALGIPLRNQGQVIGAVAGFCRTKRSMSKSQRDIMLALGDIAGVAISNARIYRQKYRIATLLQHKLSTTNIPQCDGLDIGHTFLPAREVGGDYYDFIKLGDGKLGIVVADVAGNDVDAAEYTSMGKHVMRSYAKDGASPSVVCRKTNCLLCDDTQAETFISLFYGVLDTNSRMLKMTTAGCEPVLVYKAAEESVNPLRTEGVLLGIDPNAKFREKHLQLEKGDVILLHTDGLSEAALGRQRMGTGPVKEVLVKHAHLGAQSIANSVHDLLLQYVHGRVIDDVAIVVIKVC